MNRLRTLFITAPALALLLGAAACRDRHPADGAAAAPATPVSVIALHRQSVPLSTELAGRVVASLESEVRPQISGVVRERLFVEGSDVQAGQPLYRIDPAPYQAAYDSAKAALQRAEAAVPTALARADRNAILSRAQAMSKQEYETSVETLAQARASVAVERAALETARINLAYTTIRAPISGRIDKSSLTPGALVTESQGTALTTIRLIDPINVDLTESSANLLNLRQAIDAGRVSPSGGKVRVRLRLENGASYPLEGTLQFSESSVNAATGTVTLRAVFPNPQRLLLPGMYARAVLETGAVRDAFLVPQRAIGRNPRGEATALFVRDGKVVEQVLEGAREHGNDLIVERGVHDGDQVIRRGQPGGARRRRGEGQPGGDRPGHGARHGGGAGRDGGHQAGGGHGAGRRRAGQALAESEREPRREPGRAARAAGRHDSPARRACAVGGTGRHGHGRRREALSPGAHAPDDDPAAVAVTLRDGARYLGHRRQLRPR